jgi:hypothetical protein
MPASMLPCPRRRGVRVALAAALVLAVVWPEAASAQPSSVSERAQAQMAAGAQAQVAATFDEPQVVAERARLEAGAAGPQDSAGRPITDMAGFGVRWWARHGRADFGVGVGTVAFVDPADGVGPPVAWRGALPTFTLGWRYHVAPDAAVYADATGARGLAAAASPELYNTKVGVEWQPAKSRFGFEGRSLGIQLQSGYRMSLRARKGGLGVYFRGKF